MSVRGVDRNQAVQRHHQRAIDAIDAALADPNLTDAQRSELELQREQIVGLTDNYFEGRNRRTQANAVTAAMNRAIDTIEGMDLEPSDTMNLGENKTSPVDGAPDVSGANSPTEATGDDLLDLMNDPAALVSHFQDNPTEFMESWRDLPADGRSFVMQTLQTEMQMDNQITQMITNMMKAAHDTSMSVARNLKV
ncbi:MAG: hypothetical protein ACJAYU_003346 [Bradymonadia bacterium]|jgi:hypothetical protein